MKSQLQYYFITSIAPRNDNLQLVAVESWLKHGVNVISINSKAEMAQINAIKVYKDRITSNPLFRFSNYEVAPFSGKPYATLTSFVKEGLAIYMQNGKSEHKACVVLINSDIILGTPNDSKANIAEALRYTHSLMLKYPLVFIRRLNFGSNIYQHSRDPSGMDIFFVSYKFLCSLPVNTAFRIGQPFWDYFLPRWCIKLSWPFVECVTKNVWYHKMHPLRWSSEQHCYFAREYFRVLGIQHKRRNLQEVSASEAGLIRSYTFYDSIGPNGSSTVQKSIASNRKPRYQGPAIRNNIVNIRPFNFNRGSLVRHFATNVNPKIKTYTMRNHALVRYHRPAITVNSARKFVRLRVVRRRRGVNAASSIRRSVGQRFLQ